MDPTQTTSKPNGAAHTDRMLLYIAILIGTCLRLYHLGYQSIWGDESLTLQVYSVGSNFAELWANIWERAFHPPLYFLIVHYWTLLGQSEFMARFPSAVFGIAAIPVVYYAASRLFGSRVGGISALIVALSPFHTWYSQEARMYTLQILLSAASILFFIKAWKSREKWDMVRYVAVTLLAMFTQISSVLLVMSQGLLVLGSSMKDWRKSAAWIGAQMVVMILFMPWGLHFLSVHSGVGSQDGAIGFQRETSPLHLAYALYTLSVGYSLGPSVSALHYLSPKIAILRHMPVIALSAAVFGLLGLLGLIRAYKTNRFGFWVLVTGFVVPVTLVGAASLLPGIPLNPRYIIASIIPYWIMLALGVQSCLSTRMGFAVPAMAVMLMGVSLHNHYFEPIYQKQDMRSAVSLINKQARPGDVVIASSIEIGGPFIYYFKRHDVPYFGYPPQPGLINRRTLPHDMRGILGGHKRAWLILGRTWSSDPQGVLPGRFQEHYASSCDRQFEGVSVKCFVLHN